MGAYRHHSHVCLQEREVWTKAGEDHHRERPGNTAERWSLGVQGVQSCSSSEKEPSVRVQGPLRISIVERLAQGFRSGTGEWRGSNTPKWQRGLGTVGVPAW